MKCEGETQTSDVEETETETEGDDDDGDEFNDNGDDGDNDDYGEVEIDDNDNGDNDDSSGGVDCNCVDGVTANGDVSNMKDLVGETCFLKHTILQAGKEITFTFSTTTSEQNDGTVSYETSFVYIRPNNIQQNFNTI